MYGPVVRAPEYLKCSGSPGKRSPQKGKHAPSFKRDRGSPVRPSHPNMPLRLPSSSIIRADGRTTKSIGRDESTKQAAERAGPSASSSSRLKVLTQSDRATAAPPLKKSHRDRLVGALVVAIHAILGLTIFAWFFANLCTQVEGDGVRGPYQWLGEIPVR